MKQLKTLSNKYIYLMGEYIEKSTNQIHLPINLSFYIKYNFENILQAFKIIDGCIADLTKYYENDNIKLKQEINKLMSLSQDIEYYPIARSQLEYYNYPTERMDMFYFMLSNL